MFPHVHLSSWTDRANGPPWACLVTELVSTSAHGAAMLISQTAHTFWQSRQGRHSKLATFQVRLVTAVQGALPPRELLARLRTAVDRNSTHLAAAEADHNQRVCLAWACANTRLSAWSGHAEIRVSGCMCQSLHSC